MKIKLLSSKEAAKELELSYDGLSKAIQNSRIRIHSKVGKGNFFHPKDIQEFKQRRMGRHAKH